MIWSPHNSLTIQRRSFLLPKWYARCVRTLFKTLTDIFPQLSVVESLHNQHYIHCDIKPGNFMIRTDASGERTVFLIDFGLARQFRNPATYLHIPYSTDRSIIGTLPFTSIDGQQGHAQSRRDDLESLAYTILFLARGDLPWSGLSDREAVLQKKLSTTLGELCAGLPAPFRKFVDHIRSLGFEEKPDYQYLHSILLQCSPSDTDLDTGRIVGTPCGRRIRKSGANIRIPTFTFWHLVQDCTILYNLVQGQKCQKFTR
jgi:casein kinase 1